jgi:glycosyltransferase involved in cell wall biosynthesis
MNSKRPASVIISSYNYGRFLRDAIDSALQQTCPDTEVIVVDDGSADDSPAVIASYGDRIIAILKETGGQASALNAGFTVSCGEVIIFLDSDDVLLPTAVENAIGLFEDDQTTKVQWPLWSMDEQGRRGGRKICRRPAEGDLRERVICDGPRSYAWPPTSGNAWSRTFLAKVMPIPEPEYQVSPDLYLHTLSPLLGPIKRLLEPQACWRAHGKNYTFKGSFVEKLDRSIAVWDHSCSILKTYCQNHGIEVDPDNWNHHSWFYPLKLAVQEIKAIIPPGDCFLLVDRGRWGTDEFLDQRRCIPFPKRNGRHGGAPADETTVIRELERLRRSEASFVVFGWPAIWWLDVYAELHRYLRSTSTCVLANERIVVFDLRSQVSVSAAGAD